MPDWSSIGSNLADKNRGVSGIVYSTHKPPNEIPVTPAVVAFPPDVKLEETPGLDIYTATYPVRLYIERTADFAEPLVEIEPFIDRFYEAYHSGRTLATASNVSDCRIRGHEIDHLPDYGDAYIGARFEVEVQVVVPITPRTA